MRILVLADRLSSRGGADQHLLSILRRLTARDTVELVVGACDGTAEAPCRIHQLAGLDGRGAEAVDLAAVPIGEADVVHLHNVVNLRVLEAAARWPAVATVQDHRFFCPGRGKLTATGAVCTEPLGQRTCAPCFDDGAYFDRMLTITRRRLAALGRLGRIVVLSRYMQGELVAAGLDAERVVVVPPFVDVVAASTSLDDSQPEPCVLFSGRLVTAKGVDDAVEAWRRSACGLPLVFAGTGSQRERLARAGHRVLGWLERPTLAAWYEAARVCVLPSRWQEPFGIAGLEALAYGTPVAAWDSGGIAEWHPGPGLVPWGDLEGLAAAIDELATTATPPELPSGFDASNMMGRLRDVYRYVAKKRTI